MVLRTFPAFDNEAFTVHPSSPSLPTGSPIINNSSTPVGTIFEYNTGFPYQTITLDDTSGDPDIFEDDQESGHVTVDGMGIVADGTEVESESYHFVRALDDNGFPTGPTITITVFSQMGQTSNVWGMAADAELLPGIRYVKTGGSNRGNSEYSDFVPCFTSGTRMVTSRGEVLIDDLKVGDSLITRDNGFQQIAWIGRNDLTTSDTQTDAKLRPIRIAAGSLGKNYPRQDLIVSPNHRVLFVEPDADLIFGSQEILVAAKFLTDRPGVEVLPPAPVSYFHILFERHEVVLSNETWTESFLPGPQAMMGFGAEQCDEIYSLFPELKTDTQVTSFDAARRILTRKEALVTL